MDIMKYLDCPVAEVQTFSKSLFSDKKKAKKTEKEVVHSFSKSEQEGKWRIFNKCTA